MNEPRPHTSVVYVHGMGEQRRHEEVSRLVDALDAYAGSRRRADETHPLVRGIGPRLESSREDASNPPRDVTYIRTVGISPAESPARRVVRFYEVYWAPILAEGVTTRSVVGWLLRTPLRPLRTATSPWRERQRLRRASLVRILEDEHAWPEGVAEGDFKTLGRLYDDFEGSSARRRYPKGDGASFEAFVGEKSDRTETERLLRLTRAWRGRYRRTEWWNAFLLVTIWIALATTMGLALCIAVLVLERLDAGGALTWLRGAGLTGMADALVPTWENAVPLFVAALGLFGITRFVTRFLGDVQQWVTYEETDVKHRRRKEILARGVRVLRHVLADPACERVVVVGHSLGTAVAQDILLDLTRHNRAVSPADPFAGPDDLSKIDTLITLASPIDKIHYLFESFRSPHHRYTRVVDDLRGDIGTEPFSKNRTPSIHWVNVWDTGDIISGALRSPANGRELLRRVNNVHVSTLHFPNPAASHSAYFADAKVMGALFDIIYRGKHRYRDAPLVEGQGYDYRSMDLDPGRPLVGPRIWLSLMVAVPWLTMVIIAMRISGAPEPWSRGVMTSLGVVLILLGIGLLWGRRKGPRAPL